MRTSARASPCGVSISTLTSFAGPRGRMSAVAAATVSGEVADDVGRVALERCTLAGADRLDRAERDSALFELPACNRSSADERERPEHPSVEHASAVFRRDDRAPVDPAVEEWVEGAEQAGRRQPRRRRRPGEGDQPAALDEIKLCEAGSNL